jgi:hypothetical protein
MLPLRLLICLPVLVLAAPLPAQEAIGMRSAAVVLTDDPELRASVEERLVALARSNNYDAVPSYDFAPDVEDIDSQRFVDALEERGIGAVLMLRPASVGAGASLDAVRNSVSPEVFGRMRAFARETSGVSADHLIAVVHMAIYAVRDGEVEFLSAGAVWLDEEVEDQDEGIDRLLDLVLYNVNAVRPAIRRHLGLAPLE